MTSADFYVAFSGQDTNPGTAQAPFATVARARDAVRGKIKAGLTRDIIVQIHGGTYPVTETLTFGPEDSGTEKLAITYAAAPGEKVVLSGGRKIIGWKKGTNDIWTAEIPEVKTGKWYFRQLFVNGQRAIRARTPNADEKTPLWKIKTTDVTPGAPNQNSLPITVSVDHPIQMWKNITDVELIYFNNNDASRKRVGAVNAAGQTFTLPPPHQWPPAISMQVQSHPAPGQACYFENALEMLDQPGEWYLDRTTGVLSYWPRPGEDLTKAEVIAPVVQNTLLAVVGTAAKPVRNLNFKGIKIEHVDWLLPPYGFTLMFGCLQVTSEQPKFYWIDAAVSFTYARACTFTDGGVAHAGGVGLGLLTGCTRNVIEGNQLHDLGGGGIVGGGIRSRLQESWQWADPIAPDDHKGYRIANNYIHHCGTDYFGAIGIFFALTQEALIAHNLIHDIAYSGIVISGNETPFKFARNNTVEYNHIHHVVRAVIDGAAIYVSFPQLDQGAVIRGNLIHDSDAGLYFDGVGKEQGFEGNRFEGNLVYRSKMARAGDPRKWNAMEVPVVDNLEFRDGTPWHNRWEVPSDWVEHRVFRDGAPAAEVIAAFESQAGLEPAYRRKLLGVTEPPFKMHLLTKDSRALSVWSARQFHWPAKGVGLVLVFRRDMSEEATQTLRLVGLDAATAYELKDLNAGTTKNVDGKELMEQGLTVEIQAPPDEQQTRMHWPDQTVTSWRGYRGVAWIAYQQVKAKAGTRK